MGDRATDGASDAPAEGAAGAPRGGRGLAPYVVAYTTTVLGDRVAEIALPVAVLAATGSPAAAGAVAASMQVPGLVVALSLGLWTDRASRRSLLVGADVVRVAGFLAFAALAARDVASVLPYVLVGAVVGIGNVLFGIATQAVLPQLVPPGGLGRANALLEAGDGVTTIAGPALAGAAIARLGAAWGLVLNAVSFAVSAVLLRGFLPRLDPPPVDDASGAERAGAFRRHVAEPVALVVRDRFQATVQLAFMVLSAHGISLVLAVLILGRDELGLSVTQVGLVLSAAGVGGLAMSLLATRHGDAFGTPAAVAASLLLSAVAAAGLAVAPSFWWALLANGVLDAFVTAGFIATATLRQSRTPGSALGRVSAVSAIANNLARVVGATGTGVLLTAAGGRVAVAVDAVLLAAAGLLVLAHAVGSSGDR